MTVALALEELIEGAMLAAAKGLSVVPLHGLRLRGGKLVCRCEKGGQCPTPGKHPIPGGWQEAATRDPARIGGLFGLYPEPNVGAIAGPLDDEWRLVALDIDERHGGDRSLERLNAAIGRLPTTLTDVRGRGSHSFYFAPSSCRLRGELDGYPGIEIKGGGARMAVVIPPSLHASGDRRRWVNTDASIAIIPEALLELARKTTAEIKPHHGEPRDTPYGLGALRDACDRIRGAQVGSRDNTINAEVYGIGQLVAGGEIAEGAARAGLEQAIEDMIRATPGCNVEKAREKLGRSFEDGKGRPRRAPEMSTANGATADRATTDHEAAPTHSWQPVDLVALGDAPPEPPTIGGLAYPRRRHLWSGEPETLKSWAALVLCVMEMLAGRTAMYVDLEMGAREMLERLRLLGLDDATIASRFVYLEPTEPYEAFTIGRDIGALLAERRPSLIVVDAFTGALQMQALNPDKGTDVEAYYRHVVGPLRAHGAAVIILDHLAKDKDARGQFSIGSERKVGGADVHLGFDSVRPFGRGRSGLARIMTRKDRPGFLSRPKVGELELTSDPHTGLIAWSLRLVHQDSEGEEASPFRPTRLMEHVSVFVESQPEPVSRNDVEGSVKGKATYVRLAIDLLVGEGYLGAEQGPRGAQLLRSEKPYREAHE